MFCLACNCFIVLRSTAAQITTIKWYVYYECVETFMDLSDGMYIIIIYCYYVVLNYYIKYTFLSNILNAKFKLM